MAEQTWRDPSSDKVDSTFDVRHIRVLEVTRSNIPSKCYRRKLNLMNDLLQEFEDKGDCKQTLLHLKVKSIKKGKKIKRVNAITAPRFLQENPQFTDLASKLKSIKFKEADTDFNVARAVSTMSCYEKIPREPNQDLSDSNLMDNIPDVTNKMENVNIECDTLYYGSNSIGDSVPCMQLVEKTMSLGVSDNALTNEQGAIAFSRSHREYCTNMLNRQFNESLERFVKELSRLQKNFYNRDNIKGRSRRRYYAGFKETEKRLQINKIKLVIIAPDLGVNGKNGELDNLVHRFIDCCKRYETPTIFGLSRRKLGYLTHGKGFVSCIGVANYEALEDKLEETLKKVLKAKNEFKKLTGRPEAVIDEKAILNDDLLLSERVRILLKTLTKS